MTSRTSCLRVRVALLAILVSLPGLALLRGEGPAKGAAKRPQAWTLDEAMAQLELYPNDAYLQYVALQLARREKKVADVSGRVGELIGRAGGGPRNNERLNDVDLFSLFTGSLAVQESLQLDAMRGQAARGPRAVRPGEKPVDPEQRRRQTVAVADLKGPTIKSHPWETLLGGVKVEPGPLARAVPDDFYLIEFRSLTKLLDALELSDLWGTHLFSQAAREARTQQVGERLKAQLALETNPLLRPAYDLVVDEVAVTGSDLFVNEGSDVTILFRAKSPDALRSRMDGFLDRAARAHPDAKRTAGKYGDVDFVHLATPDRALCVWSAYPAADLHVRSNSRVALERVLAAIRGKDADGHAVRRLGDTAEFQYIRTLMPRGAQEDGFVYLSDPFIRRLMGPAVKLTERRRMLCYNHLRMIGHAALLYRTEHGKAPAALDELVKAECLPGKFNEGDFKCPGGGTYALSADGHFGTCSHHGHAQYLTPCCEIPVAKVNGEEADEYKGFLDEYNNYWRTYFDPIALRLQITPQRYRLETIILPLIDNSIYTTMAQSMGGAPEALDALPVPKRNIFSVAVKLNKLELLKEVGLDEDKVAGKNDRLLDVPGVPREKIDALKVKEFLIRGIGNQVGLHAYDAVPTFDFNLPQFLGLAMGSFNGRRGREMDTVELGVSFLITALNAPVYISLPVQDVKVVDDFLDKLDPLMAESYRRLPGRGLFGINFDFYKAPLKPDRTMRVASVQFGPIKWRMFWARIGNGLYIASKPFILDDLVAAEAERAKAGAGRPRDDGPKAHGMVRMRPANWDRVLADYRLAWAEGNRQACLNNLGPLASVGRGLVGGPQDGERTEEQLGRAAQQAADRLYGAHFFCPEGGHYLLSPDGKACRCSVHGSALEPKQATEPSARGSSSALTGLREVTASLTFTKDGLRAVVVIDRK
jgi:hypothetical protein